MPLLFKSLSGARSNLRKFSFLPPGLIFVAGAGNISEARWIEARDDEDTLRQVREQQLHTPCEILEGDRMVGRIGVAEGGASE